MCTVHFFFFFFCIFLLNYTLNSLKVQIVNRGLIKEEYLVKVNILG